MTLLTPAAEKQLTADVQAIDVSPWCESARAHAFRRMRATWNRWDEHDVRWSGVDAILNEYEHPTDTQTSRAGALACAEAAELIDTLANLANGADEEHLRRLEELVAQLGEIAARLRVVHTGAFGSETTHEAVLNG